MPRTYTNLLTHAIFSTKNRQPTIRLELRANLHAYLRGIIKGVRCVPLAVNGTADHVHLLFALRPDLSAAEAIRTVKANSSKWMHETWADRRFGWQLGYAALSVSKSNVPAVAKYIEEQERHHRRMSFQEEYVAFLRKHGVTFDEKYLWE